ncbi:unnamed protein product [Cuscuta europaea]|uniref:Uncharacterized protein n=1 Tax=Cuscuta europaea TaxID=41803 RepID=A0A9P0YSZ5_CUSEU|nr:unnamed protein product [Cuscuta europaea]
MVRITSHHTGETSGRCGESRTPQGQSSRGSYPHFDGDFFIPEALRRNPHAMRDLAKVMQHLADEQDGGRSSYTGETRYTTPSTTQSFDDDTTDAEIPRHQIIHEPIGESAKGLMRPGEGITLLVTTPRPGPGLEEIHWLVAISIRENVTIRDSDRDVRIREQPHQKEIGSLLTWELQHHLP